MQDKLLQTPDGVRDTYDVECKKKRKIIEKLHHTLELYSYHDIETPTFEYFDIFNRLYQKQYSTFYYKMHLNGIIILPLLTFDYSFIWYCDIRKLRDGKTFLINENCPA